MGSKKTNKTSKNTTIGVIVGLVVVMIVVVMIFSASATDYTAFAQCLNENDVTMYGAYWCSHCENQKELFGDAFVYVDYVECDAKGLNGQPALCKEKGINGYPTWEISGNLLPGEHSLEELGEFTGCTLP